MVLYKMGQDFLDIQYGNEARDSEARDIFREEQRSRLPRRRGVTPEPGRDGVTPGPYDRSVTPGGGPDNPYSRRRRNRRGSNSA